MRLGRGVLVIIPTFNERESLASVVQRIHLVCPEANVLIVDDNSPDGTGDLADELARDERVHVLHRPQKSGLGTAYVEGFSFGLQHGFQVLVECDADGSHRPEELPLLLAAIGRGADAALGSRWVSGGRIVGWPWYRQLISRTGTLLARATLGSSLKDMTSGYRALTATSVAHLPLEAVSSQGYGFQVEVAWTLERFGAIVREVPITFVEREAGHSKMSLAIVLETLVVLARWGWLRWFAPSRLPRPNRLPSGW